MGLIGDMHAGFRERGIIITVESGEMLRIAFGGTVSSEKTVLEIDRHFGHDGVTVLVLCRGDFDSGQEVLFRIAAGHTDR